MSEAKRILIVDDNEAIHADIKSILLDSVVKTDDETRELENELFGISIGPEGSAGGSKYIIDDAYQGEEALELVALAAAQNAPYSLVFMDVRMPPGIDGIQTIEMMWRKFPFIEVVICTAFTDYTWDEIITRFQDSDKLMLLKKPFEPILLRQLTSSLTKKWELQRQSTDSLQAMKQEVSERNLQIRKLSSELRRMKEEHGDGPDQKRSFFADISFKIRTPLTDLFGLSEALQETELSKEQVDYTASINSAVNSMLDQMQNVYDSALEDELQLEDTPFRLRDILDEIEKNIKTRIGSKPLEFNHELDKDLPDLIGDSKRLKQVLTSLLENAIQYTDKGEVVLRTTVEATEGDGRLIKFVVKDSGKGMPEAILRAINDGNGELPVRGRGLKLVMKILKRMNSELHCDSKPGAGTELGFTLTFNVARAQDVTVVSEDEPVQFEKLKVLLVEDNVTNQLVLKGMLGRYGLAIDIVQNGEHAIEAFQVENYDIIYMDWHMPGMDGLEATREIRKLEKERGTRIPIIAVTANVLPGDKEKCLEAGMDDYLAKPIRQKDILRTLSRWGNASKNCHAITSRGQE